MADGRWQMAAGRRLALGFSLICGVLLIIGAAGAAPKNGSPKPSIKVIDTGGPVEMQKCLPCHKDLSRFKNPRLINFNHPVHFKRGIRCQACHTVFPHRPGGTVRPTMDVCANCHRLQHGNQGKMASLKCDLCHPPDFKLTPDNHEDKAFAASAHAAKARLSKQECLVCHEKNDCEACHAAKKVAPASSKSYRWLALWRQPPKQGYKIKIGEEPVAMEDCRVCHTDLQRWKNAKLVNFNHPAHFKRQIACPSCHDKWPHLQDKVEKPKMGSCVRCHRLTHAAQGRLVAAEQGRMPPEYCATCHPPNMELKPDWHTPEFVGGDHKRFAKKDRGLCRGCHVQSFCDRCHQIEIPHGPGWLGEHGIVAISLEGQGDRLICFRCHKKQGPQAKQEKSPSCAKCHKAVVFPHPEPWAPQHGKTAKGEGRGSCATCHIKQQFCDRCHGKVEMPHAADWLGEHRQFLRDNPAQACLTCHQKTQCEQCHAVHKVHNQHTIFKM